MTPNGGPSFATRGRNRTSTSVSVPDWPRGSAIVRRRCFLSAFQRSGGEARGRSERRATRQRTIVPTVARCDEKRYNRREGIRGGVARSKKEPELNGFTWFDTNADGINDVGFGDT